jgi:hypothetical protein
MVKVRNNALIAFGGATDSIRRSLATALDGF